VGLTGKVCNVIAASLRLQLRPHQQQDTDQDGKVVVDYRGTRFHGVEDRSFAVVADSLEAFRLDMARVFGLALTLQENEIRIARLLLMS
jgi:hypothetical protein